MIVIAIAVLIDRDASIVGAADSRAHGRRIAASPNDRNRGHLGNEDTIELGIRRHRMRARRLRTFSTNVLDSASITPSTAVCWPAVGQGDPGVVQSRLEPV